MNTSKTAVIFSKILGKISSFIGYTIGILSLLIILIELFDTNSEDPIGVIFVFLVILAICVLLVFKGRKIKNRIKRFKQYVSLISNQNMTSFQNLASATSQSVDFVKNDLQQMIDKGFFANASLNLKSNEIVVENCIQTITNTNTDAQQSIPIDVETVKCSSCGAVNSKQKGTSFNCDYCGSPL